MEKLEAKRILATNEARQIHQYGFKLIPAYFIFLLFSLVAIIYVTKKIIAGQLINSDWSAIISIIIFYIIFGGATLSCLFGLKNSIFYSKIKSGEKVYLIKDRFHTKGNRYGVRYYLGNWEIDFVTKDSKKQMKDLKYGELITVEAIKGDKEYLIIKILSVDNENKGSYRFDLKTGEDPKIK